MPRPKTATPVDTKSEPSGSNGVSTLSTKARRTRAALLSAARTVFERDGLTDARVTDIAQEAGVAHGSFYTYFDSKMDIFNELAFEFFAELREAISKGAPGPESTPYKAIYRTNRTYVEVLHKNASLVVLLWMQTASHKDELADRHKAEKEYFITRAQRGIERFQEHGLATADIDARYAARALGGMIEQFCVQWFLNDLDYETDKAAHVLSEIWARAIGVAIDPSVD